MAHVPPDVRFRSLVASALALAACSSKAVPPPAAAGQSVGAQALSCEDRPGDPVGTGLTPAEPVDAVAMAVVSGGKVELRPLVGQVCAAGTTCVEPLLDEAIRTDCHQVGCSQSSVVWSRDGEAAAATTRDALLDFLGDVDSPGDARLVAWASGYEPTACAVRPHESGLWKVTVTRQISDCPITVDAYDLTISRGGQVVVAAHRPGTPTQVCIGRLPTGLTCIPDAGPGVARWLARAAQLEAASVHAFAHLHAELVFHGAPAELCEAALACLDDEVRHARIVGDLARSLGAEVTEVTVAPTPIRGLFAIACDNAVEGCGREAWGAVLGRWQAERATLEVLRPVMAEVAADELRHAEFSFALDAWLRTQLAPGEVAQLDRASRRARRRLAHDAQQPVARPLREALGLPTTDEARALFTALT